MLLLVVSHEVTQALQGAGEGLRIGQEHQAEVIRVLPVERAAVAEENLLALEQIQGELFIVGNVEALNINLREQIERTVRAGAADAVNLIEHLVRQGALLVQAAAGNNQLVNGLVAAERGLDGVLCRNVGAQAHGGEQVNAFQVAGSVLLRAVIATQPAR